MLDDHYSDQFSFEKSYYTDSIDFLNWYRQFFLFKDVLSHHAGKVLEVGVGSGLLRSSLVDHVGEYHTFDINDNLSPDYVGDIRIFDDRLSKYDCIVIADMLEHVPFSDLPMILQNIFSYLNDSGVLLVTIPHRQSNFLFMSPTQVPHVFTVPTGFLSLGAFYRRFIKRKIWIDPNHCWEIGDGTVKVKDVEKCFKEAGLLIEKFEKLLYVDYWILKKS